MEEGRRGKWRRDDEVVHVMYSYLNPVGVSEQCIPEYSIVFSGRYAVLWAHMMYGYCNSMMDRQFPVCKEEVVEDVATLNKHVRSLFTATIPVMCCGLVLCVSVCVLYVPA